MNTTQGTPDRFILDVSPLPAICPALDRGQWIEYLLRMRANGLIKRISAPGMDLRGANLSGGNLRGGDFRGADFRGADLYAADFRGADFRGADVRGADLGRADLRGALYDDTTRFPERLNWRNMIEGRSLRCG